MSGNGWQLLFQVTGFQSEKAPNREELACVRLTIRDNPLDVRSGYNVNDVASRCLAALLHEEARIFDFSNSLIAVEVADLVASVDGVSGVMCAFTGSTWLEYIPVPVPNWQGLKSQ